MQMQMHGKDLLDLHSIMIVEKYKTLIKISKYYILKLYLTIQQVNITSVNDTIKNLF